MQHRLNVRIPLRTEVEIFSPRPEKTRIHGQTLDLSLDGARIATETPELHAKTFVRVRFPGEHDERDAPLELSAYITRLTTDGAALMFTDHNPEAFYGLVNCLRRTVLS